MDQMGCALLKDLVPPFLPPGGGGGVSGHGAYPTTSVRKTLNRLTIGMHRWPRWPVYQVSQVMLKIDTFEKPFAKWKM